MPTAPKLGIATMHTLAVNGIRANDCHNMPCGIYSTTVFLFSKALMAHKHKKEDAYHKIELPPLFCVFCRYKRTIKPLRVLQPPHWLQPLP